jgi:hypothetical protein
LDNRAGVESREVRPEGNSSIEHKARRLDVLARSDSCYGNHYCWDRKGDFCVGEVMSIKAFIDRARLRQRFKRTILIFWLPLMIAALVPILLVLIDQSPSPAFYGIGVLVVFALALALLVRGKVPKGQL